MTPTEVLRTLQRIRYSPPAGRPFPITWIARQAGYHGQALHRAQMRGRITPDMAKRLSPVLARIALAAVPVDQGNIAPTLGQLGAGTRALPAGRALPRGGGRPPEAPRRRPRKVESGNSR